MRTITALITTLENTRKTGADEGKEFPLPVAHLWTCRIQLKYNPSLRVSSVRLVLIMAVVFKLLSIYLSEGGGRGGVKLPKHLWRSVLDNVPRANFPRSVLNGHALARPAPAAARRPMERGRGVRTAIEAQRRAG